MSCFGAFVKIKPAVCVVNKSKYREAFQTNNNSIIVVYYLILKYDFGTDWNIKTSRF